MTHLNTCPHSQVNTAWDEGDATDTHRSSSGVVDKGSVGLNTRRVGENGSRSNYHSLDWWLTLGCPSGAYAKTKLKIKKEDIEIVLMLISWAVVILWGQMFCPDGGINFSRDTDLKSITDTLLNPGSPSRASSICKGENDRASQTGLVEFVPNFAGLTMSFLGRNKSDLLFRTG